MACIHVYNQFQGEWCRKFFISKQNISFHNRDTKEKYISHLEGEKKLISTNYFRDNASPTLGNGDCSKELDTRSGAGGLLHYNV